MAIVEVQDLVKAYERGRARVCALDGVSCTVAAGEFVTVMGPSGAGKSTLLHLLGALDTPTSGTVVLDGDDLGAASDEQLTLIRRRKLGFIFQFFNLLPTMSAWENVALPRLLDGIPLSATRDRAIELLELVGLGARIDHRPAELSGGEMQRVAIARALVADPVLVLADEPTGNLDSATGTEVLGLLRDVVRERSTTLVMVTHDPRAASVGDRLITLADGRIAADGTPAEVLDRPVASVPQAAPAPGR